MGVGRRPAPANPRCDRKTGRSPTGRLERNVVTLAHETTSAPEQAPPRYSVIIVNFNAGARLARCLDCLAAQSFRDFEIIVFDNNSRDQSIAQARERAPEARFILNPDNIGFAAANNRAAEVAAGQWLVFLNPDAYAEAEWIAALDAATYSYPGVDAFGSTQINADDPSVIDGAGDVLHILGIPYRGHFGWSTNKMPPEGECFAPCGAAAMYKKAAFDALGGFDERFFCYSEDVDLGFRLRLAGGRTVQLRNARVLHEGSGVTGRHSDFTIYHGHRNRIWMTYKNMPGLFYWPLWPLRRLADLYLLARSFSVGINKPYLKALRDGYGGLPALREDRLRLQRARRARLFDLAGAFAWSLFKVSRRQAKITPFRREASSSIAPNDD